MTSDSTGIPTKINYEEVVPADNTFADRGQVYWPPAGTSPDRQRARFIAVLGQVSMTVDIW
jgi:hypothetical protein